MTSRSTASPSRLPSSDAPWILMRSTMAGFAPGTGGGTSVWTCAAAHDGVSTSAQASAGTLRAVVVIMSGLNGNHRDGFGLHVERDAAVLNRRRDGPRHDRVRCFEGIDAIDLGSRQRLAAR